MLSLLRFRKRERRALEIGPERSLSGVDHADVDIRIQRIREDEIGPERRVIERRRAPAGAERLLVLDRKARLHVRLAAGLGDLWLALRAREIGLRGPQLRLRLDLRDILAHLRGDGRDELPRLLVDLALELLDLRILGVELGARSEERRV